MKPLIITGLIGLTFSSCFKDRHIYFTEQQLLLVSYAKGQNLKFIDTASVVQTLEQSAYSRAATQVAAYPAEPKPAGDYIERYDVSYNLQNTDSEELRIDQSARNIFGFPLICFFSYCTIDLKLDSLAPPLPALTVNGKTYTDVYSLKLVKNGYIPYSSTDFTTLHYNKEDGVIEMLFPDGKKIIRTE